MRRIRLARQALSVSLSATILAAPAVLTLTSAPAARAQASASEQEFLFAYKLMQRGDTAEAGAAFDAFLEKFPQDAQRGDALYFRAALYRQNGALRAAAELLAGATGRFAPQRVPAYAVQLLRGQVLTDLGEYDQAVASLEQIELEALPDRAVASVRLLQALAYRGAGNFEASANAASAAASVSSPVKGAAMMALARAQALGGDNAAALETLGKTLAFDDASANAEAARLAGDLSYAQGEYDQATAFYTRVIERDQSSSEFAPAVVGRMWADLQAGRNVAVVSADQQFGEALAPGPRATAAYLVASAYQAIDQHAPAAERLTPITAGLATGSPGELAEELRPLALYKLAVSQFELARYDDMAKTVDTLEKRFPGVPQQIDASFLLASADAKQGRAAEGVARLNRFIEAGPDNPYFAQALLRRAGLYEQSGEAAAAADDLTRYLESTGQPWSASPTVALRYADLSHRLGNYEQVINTAQTLVTPDAAPAVVQEALYRLGEAQTRSGGFREALATFDKLQADHPINPYRHAVDLRRGLLLSKLGRPEESMAVLLTSADDPQLPTPQRVAALRIIAAQLRDDGRADDAAVVLRRMENLAGLVTLSDNELLWLGDYEVQRGEADASVKTLAVFDGTSRKLSGVAESELLFTRGRAYFMLDDLENAHRNFFGVVALGRGFDLEARLFLARTEIKRGNLDAALIELSDLTNADDGRIVAEALYETGQAHRARATLLQRRGDTAGAAEQRRAARASIKRMVLLYLTVDALYPLPPQGLIGLAEIADALDEPQARDKELAELIRAFPDSPYADYARALGDQLGRNRPDDALARLQRLDFDQFDPVLRGWVESKVAELEALR